MSPTTARGKQGKVYRYYVSAALQQGAKSLTDDDVIRRVPAAALEDRLADIIRRTIRSPSEPLSLLDRVEIHPRSLHLMMPVRHLPAVKTRLLDGEHAEKDEADPSRLRLDIPVSMQPRGGRTWIVGGKTPAARPDPVLIRALRAAHQLVTQDATGMPVLKAAPASPYRRRLVRLAFLAPDLQAAILAGRQPPGLTLAQLMEGPVPPSWIEQARLFNAGTAAANPAAS